MGLTAKQCVSDVPNFCVYDTTLSLALGISVPSEAFICVYIGADMAKTGWIYNVTKEIAKKASLGEVDLSCIGTIEKQASIKLGIVRCKKEVKEPIGHYAQRLIKHFDLVRENLVERTPLKEKISVQKKQKLSDKKHRGKNLGKFGAASKVRNIDPSTIDLSKYLND
jgi:hypothetical protein